MIDLAGFEISATRGFLPDADPPRRLPAAFEPWEALADRLSSLLAADRFRREVAVLPLLDPAPIPDGPLLERAMLTLSVLGTGYVQGEDPKPAPALPAQLARPWDAVASRLGRPTIIAHSSYVLQNWHRIDPAGEVELGNIGCQRTFLGGLDEQWFVLVTVAIEAAGAPVLSAIVAALAAGERRDRPALAAALDRLRGGVDHLTALLERMYQHCDPRTFYLRVRPMLAGWPEPGVRFDGVPGPPRALIGGSAAQSTLIQAIDAGLGVRHEHPSSGPFLLEMRRYMPPRHRAFLERLEAGPSIRDRVEGLRDQGPELALRYDEAIDAVDRFRKRHLEIAARYITRQAAGADGDTGTGGTEFTTFLTTARRETGQRRLEPRG